LITFIDVLQSIPDTGRKPNQTVAFMNRMIERASSKSSIQQTG